MAMATGASAAIIGGCAPGMAMEPTGSVRAAQPANSNIPPFLHTRAATDSSAQTQAPFIEPGGVVPIFSTVNVIQPGEWVTIYGTNLSAETASWNGSFPTSLGGASVTINGKAAYLLYVSPNQINLQAPDDTATGSVPVVVTTAAGSGTSTVTLAKAAPSFSLFSQYVCGIILRSDGSGAYGGGSFDILGPTGNSLGFQTVAAQPGDIVSLYGVGFGPTTPAVPAGEVFSGAAPINDKMDLYINHVLVDSLFVGLSSAGLYQINLVVPQCLGEGEVPIRAFVGGAKTQSGVMFSLQSGSNACSATNGGGGGGTYTIIPVGSGFVGGSGGGTVGPPPGGTAGGTAGGNPGTTEGGGTGGGGTAAFKGKKPYQPRLLFAPKRNDGAG
jgi:uncharacterized protein (TIGR03437 family)